MIPRNRKASIILPEESHTPNRTYDTFYKEGHDVQAIAKYGHDVKAIAKYGPDGKKIWEIHTFNTFDVILTETRIFAKPS